MGSQRPPRQKDTRPLEDRRREAHERMSQWIADGNSAVEAGNAQWAAECASRAERWLTELAAIDAMLNYETRDHT